MSAQKLIFDPDTTYSNRKGYDENLLGSETIELPKISSAVMNDVYTVAAYQTFYQNYKNGKKNDPNQVPVPAISIDKNTKGKDPLVLKYHHYSLVLNCAYRMCLYTATNCDYTIQMRQHEIERNDFEDTWNLDPRVPQEFQLTNTSIYRSATKIDRGHVNRREDSCWGKEKDVNEAVYANSDTFHWTNCTPQHELFNRSEVRILNENTKAKKWESIPDPEYTGLAGVWGDFERWFEYQIHFIPKKDPGKKAVIFAGPVLMKNRGAFKNNYTKSSVQYPNQFWKVIVIKDDKSGLLGSAGFVFDQSKSIKYYGLVDQPGTIKAPMHADPPYNANNDDRFKRFQKSIKDIEKMTGLQFSDKVRDADQFKKSEFPCRGATIQK